MSTKKQFIMNTASGWFSQFCIAIISMFMIPYNIRHLGTDVYGISVLAVSAITLMQFLSLGMGPALLRFFSHAIVRNDRAEIKKLSSTSQLLLGCLGAVGGTAIILSTGWFTRFYNVPLESQHDTVILLWCLGLAFFLDFNSIVFSNIVLASNRYDIVNINNIVMYAMRFGLMVLFYNCFSASLASLGAAILVGSVYYYGIMLFLSFRENGTSVFFSASHVARNRLPELFSFSFLSLINSVFFAASIQVPIMIIGKTLSKEMVTAFNPAILIATFLSAILGKFSAPLTPLASRDLLTNEGKNLGRWAILFGQIVACVGYGCISMGILFSEPLLFFWLGPDFIWIRPIVIVLIIGIVYAGIQVVSYNLALGASSIAPIAYSAVVMAILTSLGTLLGTCYWHWELLEVAICITVVRILRNTFFIPWVYSKLFAYRFSVYFFQVYVKTVTPGLLLLGMAALIHAICPSFFPSRSIAWTVGLLLITGLVYLGLTWFLVLGKQTRQLFMKKRN